MRNRLLAVLATASTDAVLLPLAAAPASAESTRSPRLKARAVLPAATFAPGPASGAAIGPGPFNGVTVPFAVLPPANNPFMDQHLIYAMVLGVLTLTAAGKTLGLGLRWEQIPLVARHGALE